MPGARRPWSSSAWASGVINLFRSYLGHLAFPDFSGEEEELGAAPAGAAAARA